MNHSLGILSNFIKCTWHLVHFITNFELQIQEASKFFSYFWLQLIRKKSSKKLCPWFLITFLFFEILAYIRFLFPLKLVLKIENPLSHKSCTFYRELRAQFSQRLFSQMFTTFKGILELKHCTLTNNPRRRLILFRWYCNFMHLQD